MIFPFLTIFFGITYLIVPTVKVMRLITAISTSQILRITKNKSYSTSDTNKTAVAPYTIDL